MKVDSGIRCLLLLSALSLGLLGACGCSREVERQPGATALAGDEEFIVLPLQTNAITVELREGETLAGYMTISGGNNDINVYVKDDYGNTVIDLGKVAGTREFYFDPDEPGFYTIYFDNSFSVSVNKQINLHYSVR